jgi:hypothetical protein
MSKEVILYDNFKDIKNKHGVFALLDMESCMSCSQYLKDLKKYNTSDWTIVAMTKENSEEMFLEESLRPPVTRVYNNNSIIEEMRGILYSLQIKKLYNAISKIANNSYNKNIKVASTDFKIGLAKQKNITVQCFLVKQILDVELLGQKIIAREGQWIVMYDDNKIEVLNDEDFIRRFENIGEK